MWHHAGLQAGTEVHSENLQQSVPKRGNKHKQKRRDSSSSDECISGDPVKEFVKRRRLLDGEQDSENKHKPSREQSQG